MMSQRGGTVSYLTFAAGFSLAVYALFYLCVISVDFNGASFARSAPTPWSPTCCT